MFDLSTINFKVNSTEIAEGIAKLKELKDVTESTSAAQSRAAAAASKSLEAQAKAESERKAQEAREADKAHKKKVCDSILVELSKLNIDEQTGKDLIKAIYNNQIPNITIKF